MVLLDCYWLTKKMGMDVEYLEYMKYLIFMGGICLWEDGESYRYSG